ncbi:hypothetical protein HK100_012126 [Physocladia obscura]|uniref:Uncharacterized protein n=1 Tax=Physocladia obscura TaxID=109957 RepID=A0AAD5XGH1_9FUNG|nr:hypothetical protein HK100_012126 [Physocladia obscura]
MVTMVESLATKDKNCDEYVRRKNAGQDFVTQSQEAWSDQLIASSADSHLNSRTIKFARDDSSSSLLTPLQIGLIAAASAIVAIFAAVYITARLHRWKSKFARLVRRKQQQQETTTTVEALFGVTPETNILAERLKQQQQSTLLRQQQQQWRQSTAATALPDEFLISTTSLFTVDRPTPATITSINRVSHVGSFFAAATVTAPVSDELSAIAASVFDANNPTEYNAQIMAEIRASTAASSIINGGGGSAVGFGITASGSAPVTPSPVLPSYAMPTISRTDRRMSRLSSSSGVSSPAAMTPLSPEDLAFAKKFNRYSRAYSDAGGGAVVVGGANGNGAAVPRAGSRAESYWDGNSNSNIGPDEINNSSGRTGTGSVSYSAPNLVRSALSAAVELSAARTTSSPAYSISNNDDDGSGGGGGGESSEQEQKSAAVANGVVKNTGRRRSSSSILKPTTTTPVVVKKKSRSANHSAHASPRISTTVSVASTSPQYTSDLLFEYTHEWMQYFDLNPDAADESADETEKWKIFYVEYPGARRMAEKWDEGYIAATRDFSSTISENPTSSSRTFVAQVSLPASNRPNAAAKTFVKTPETSVSINAANNSNFFATAALASTLSEPPIYAAFASRSSSSSATPPRPQAPPAAIQTNQRRRTPSAKSVTIFSAMSSYHEKLLTQPAPSPNGVSSHNQNGVTSLKFFATAAPALTPTQLSPSSRSPQTPPLKSALKKRADDDNESDKTLLDEIMVVDSRKTKQKRGEEIKSVKKSRNGSTTTTAFATGGESDGFTGDYRQYKHRKNGKKQNNASRRSSVQSENSDNNDGEEDDDDDDNSVLFSIISGNRGSTKNVGQDVSDEDNFALGRYFPNYQFQQQQQPQHRRRQRAASESGIPVSGNRSDVSNVSAPAYISEEYMKFCALRQRQQLFQMHFQQQQQQAYAASVASSGTRQPFMVMPPHQQQQYGYFNQPQQQQQQQNMFVQLPAGQIYYSPHGMPTTTHILSEQYYPYQSAFVQQQKMNNNIARTFSGSSVIPPSSSSGSNTVVVTPSSLGYRLQQQQQQFQTAQMMYPFYSKIQQES